MCVKRERKERDKETREKKTIVQKEKNEWLQIEKKKESITWDDVVVLDDDVNDADGVVVVLVVLDDADGDDVVDDG